MAQALQRRRMAELAQLRAVQRQAAEMAQARARSRQLESETLAADIAADLARDQAAWAASLGPGIDLEVTRAWMRVVSARAVESAQADMRQAVAATQHHAAQSETGASLLREQVASAMADRLARRALRKDDRSVLEAVDERNSRRSFAR
jgi:hypothetical protein